MKRTIIVAALAFACVGCLTVQRLDQAVRGFAHLEERPTVVVIHVVDHPRGDGRAVVLALGGQEMGCYLMARDRRTAEMEIGARLKIKSTGGTEPLEDATCTRVNDWDRDGSPVEQKELIAANQGLILAAALRDTPKLSLALFGPRWPGYFYTAEAWKDIGKLLGLHGFDIHPVPVDGWGQE